LIGPIFIETLGLFWVHFDCFSSKCMAANGKNMTLGRIGSEQALGLGVGNQCRDRSRGLQLTKPH
jgi:hypothetical protein